MDLKKVIEIIGIKELSSTAQYSYMTNLHKRNKQEMLAAHYARHERVIKKLP
jgi:hypothetical protein